MLTRMSGRLVVALSVVLGLVASSQAGIVQSMSGSGYTAIGPQSGTVFTLTGNAAPAIYTETPGPGGVVGITPGSLRINLTNYASNNTVGNAALLNLANVAQLTLTDVSGTATFEVFNPSTKLNNLGGGPLTSFLVDTILVLTADTSALDYGPINQVYTFTLSGNGSNLTFSTGAPGSFNLPAGNTASASFTLINTNTVRQTGDPVPEPVSMALFGLIGLGGVIAARRKMRKTVA